LLIVDTKVRGPNSRAFMRCPDEGGLGGTVEIARRKCRTFLSTFCQLNYIKHGSSPTQCVVATPEVGHSPQAGPSTRESVVSIESCDLGSVNFLCSGRGWRPGDELHWGETPAWLRREIAGAGGCAVARPLLSSSPGGPPLAHFSQVALAPGVSLSHTPGVAGAPETSSIGERCRPGCDPAERPPGPVAALSRGPSCRPPPGSPLWRTPLSVLWPRRHCFWRTPSMAGVPETSPIGGRHWPGPLWCASSHCRGPCAGPCTHMSGSRVPGLRGLFCRPPSGSLFWRDFFSLWPPPNVSRLGPLPDQCHPPVPLSPLSRTLCPSPGSTKTSQTTLVLMTQKMWTRLDRTLQKSSTAPPPMGPLPLAMAPRPSPERQTSRPSPSLPCPRRRKLPDMSWDMSQTH